MPMPIVSGYDIAVDGDYVLCLSSSSGGVVQRIYVSGLTQANGNGASLVAVGSGGRAKLFNSQTGSLVCEYSDANVRNASISQRFVTLSFKGGRRKRYKLPRQSRSIASASSKLEFQRLIAYFNSSGCAA